MQDMLLLFFCVTTYALLREQVSQLWTSSKDCESGKGPKATEATAGLRGWPSGALALPSKPQLMIPKRQRHI